MRGLLLVPILLASLACGSSKLSRREAERDLRKDYPVVVTVAFPKTASALKGSPEHTKLVSLQEHLARTGWFSVQRRAEGAREHFTFQLAPAAPKSVRTTPNGFQLPAAEADFVKATRIEAELVQSTGMKAAGRARVTYQVRLVRPTAEFPLFQLLHPGVKPGDTRDRHASYRKEGRSWILQNTDETFRRAQ